jgi:hypothetical protein
MMPMARLFLLLLALWGTGAAAQDWRPPIFPAPAGAVRLEARGVQPDTGADVADAINAVLKALRPGQTLLLQAGTYRLSKPVRLPSGISLQGPQDAQGQPLATLEATHVFRGPDRQMPPLVANANWSAEGPADRMIRVAALRLRHETYGVELRRVEDATIEGCAFEGGMDATAILGGRRTRVAHNLSRNTRNAAWDHWNSSEDAVVEDNIAFIAKGHGILFNAVGSHYEPGTSRGFTARRNIIRGVGSDSVGIWVSPLGRGGGHIAGTITIEGNDIAAPQPGVRSAGILVRAADAELVVVRGNRVADVRGYPAIAVGPYSREEGGTDKLPARVVVEGNHLRDNLVSRTGGVVRAAGVAVEVRGNRQTGSGFHGGGNAPGLTLCRRSTPAQEPVVMACGAD